MSQPRITTIITTYKRPQLLKRAIESVLSQTYPSFQVCIYDNASGDETAKIVAELQKKDSRIKYQCHPKNIGMMANYEHALSHVDTPLFSILSDDDLVLPNFYETALNGFAVCPEAHFSAGSTLIVTQEGSVVAVPVEKWIREGKYFPPEGVLEMIGKWLPPTGVLFRKEVLKAACVSTSIPLFWDCDFMFQMAASFPIYISKTPCAIFFHHSHSYSATQDAESCRIAIAKMIENMRQKTTLTNNTQEQIEKKLLAYLKNFSYGYIRHYILEKKYEQAELAIKQYEKNYGPHYKITLLDIIRKACVHLSCMHHCLNFLKRQSKYLQQKQDRKQYAQILKHLEH